jgi:hypothetical protein
MKNGRAQKMPGADAGWTRARSIARDLGARGVAIRHIAASIGLPAAPGAVFDICIEPQ